MTGSRINDAREFLNSLMDSPIKLPVEPVLLPTLFASMSDSSRSSMKDLAALVARSQSLTAKVLSVANSACYGLLTSVTTLERAIQVLGLMDLRTLVLMFSMSEAIPNKDLPKGFPHRHLWEHQMRTAKLGRVICQAIGEAPGAPAELPEPESIYAAGILHDLGKVILAYRRPLDWHNITNINNYKGLAISQAEDEYWGIDHGSIGAIVLKDWNLPDLLTDMVNWHHHPALAVENKLAVRILAAANTLAECKMLPEMAFSKEQEKEPELALPQEFVSMLPEYSTLLGAHYAELFATFDDKHTSTFVGAC